jgi:asparagine synthase (glutamine-hydrolysing)
MLRTISHRGPDDHGFYDDDMCSLAHARLSIVDLEGGKQPMSDASGNACVVYNGEIYNHRDLRAGLAPAAFRTNSDTEVLLHLSAAGDQAREWVAALDGMFAFVIVNGVDWTMARDPLGIKPLYVGSKDGALLFASEIKGVLATSDNVAEFPPGHVCSSRSGLHRYYRLPRGSQDVTDPRCAREGLLQRLEPAVSKRLMADVPVGVFLSGGLDSSLIAALARRHKEPLDTFSVGTEGSPDRRHALEAAAYLGTRHHEYVYTLEEAIDALPEIISCLESFDCALIRSAIPNYFLARLASRHVKVALSGEGADELFAGYQYLKQLEPSALHDELTSITESLHNTNLQRCDRMSMAHGLEVRVPFLDLDVVAYAFRMPNGLKLAGPSQTEKWVLRRAAEGVLPDNIVWRRKAKFAIGSGLGDKLARFAEDQITDSQFAREREVGDGVLLRSKEELFYYRVFRTQYSRDDVLPLVGRSRSV